MTSTERLMEIRRADAFTNAATVLMDAKEKGVAPEADPEVWADIREHVIPLLEAEADKGSES